ncbi:MAG TPA: hypothetical protein IGR64_10900 [Leptolyngbyaceae cyanobacterium M65_K2018_010]|nr:hypothetical protein [Leptolyngbyaceae cyanobacterium M65_K2018_010]
MTIKHALDPSCPHVTPSLDHIGGYYCNRGCDRYCHSHGDTVVSDSSSDSSSDSLESRKSTESRLWNEFGSYTSKGRLYYRYRWGHGHSIDGVRHIPGGTISRPVVQQRGEQIRQAMTQGKSHTEILGMIDGWR